MMLFRFAFFTICLGGGIYLLYKVLVLIEIIKSNIYNHTILLFSHLKYYFFLHATNQTMKPLESSSLTKWILPTFNTTLKILLYLPNLPPFYKSLPYLTHKHTQQARCQKSRTYLTCSRSPSLHVCHSRGSIREQLRRPNQASRTCSRFV